MKTIIMLLVLLLGMAFFLPSFYFGQPVMWQCHDYIIHPARLAVIEEAFKAGTLIPNWLSNFNFGFGSPSMLFSWFLPYYPALGFRLLGLSLVDSIKLVFLLSTIASGLGMFYLGRKISNNYYAGLAAMSAYVLSPVRINFLFTRCSYGETFALGLVPWILLVAISKIRYKSIVLGLLLGALVISHFLSFLFIMAILGLWILVVDRKRETMVQTMIALTISLGITAFYWIPSLFEQKFTNYLHVSSLWYKDQFPSLMSMINSKWQYGPPQPNRQEYSMSFQLGKGQLLISTLLVAIYFLRKKVFNSYDRRVSIFLIVILFLSAGLELPIAKSLWDHAGLLQMITFPWRLQTIAMLAMAIMTGMLVCKLPLKKLVVMVIIILLVITNRNHFFAAKGNYASDSYLKSFQFDGSSVGEYLPVWADMEAYSKNYKNQSAPEGEIVKSNKNITLNSVNRLPTKIDWNINVERGELVVFKQYYFPGWEVMIDRKKVPAINSMGLLAVDVPGGEHMVTAEYRGTKLRQISGYLSVISMVVLIGGLFYRKKV